MNTESVERRPVVRWHPCGWPLAAPAGGPPPRVMPPVMANGYQAPPTPPGDGYHRETAEILLVEDGALTPLAGHWEPVGLSGDGLTAYQPSFDWRQGARRIWATGGAP